MMRDSYLRRIAERELYLRHIARQRGFIINPFAYGIAVSSSSAWSTTDKDADITVTNLNQTANITSPALGAIRGNTGFSTGAHQFECTPTVDGSHYIGIGKSTAAITNSFPGSDGNGFGWRGDDSRYYYNGTSVLGGFSFTAADVIGVVWYAATGDFVIYKNGRFVSIPNIGASGTFYPMWGPSSTSGGTRTCVINVDTQAYPVAGVTNWAGTITPSAVNCWNSGDKDADVTVLAGGTVASVTSAGSTIGAIRGTTGRSSGVYQCEFIIPSSTGVSVGGQIVGLGKSTAAVTNSYPGADANGYGYFSTNGQKQNNGTGSAYGATFTNDDVIGVVYDAGAGTIVFYKNGSSQGTAFSSVSGTLYPMWGPGTSSSGTRRIHLNTGQTAFVYPVGGATAWG